MRRVLAFTLLALSLTACGPDAEVVPAAQARSELINRNWLDVWPEAADDSLKVYRFTPSMGGGVFQDRTVFEGSFELFTFDATHDRLTIRFPGRDEVHETDYRIERVEGPHPFTRRLVLEDDPRGPGTYYGWDEHQTAAPFRTLR
ncbi:MAG: hypothetical protein AB8I08_36755 [Sandaracinaceae bacterium]